MTYKYTVISLASEINPDAFSIEREDENGNKCWIPNDPANSDYQRYLKWLENPDAEEVTPMFNITTEQPTEQTQEGEE
jgi:hypothetical protein